MPESLLIKRESHMSSRVKTVCLALVVVSIAACQRDNPPVELDGMVIDAARQGVIIDRATQGLDLDPRKPQASPDKDATQRLEIDREQRDAALKLLILRNRLLHEDRITEEAARESHWPNWILLPPESSLTPTELQERQAWLDKEVAALTKHGCEVGAAKTGNALYCSVE
jgi:hypothetical protein